MLPNSTITAIAGKNGHMCTDPYYCLGEEHEVTVDGALPTQVGRVNLVVVRHGIEPSDAVLGQRLPLAEQLSPFELPPM